MGAEVVDASNAVMAIHQNNGYATIRRAGPESGRMNYHGEITS